MILCRCRSGCAVGPSPARPLGRGGLISLPKVSWTIGSTCGRDKVGFTRLKAGGGDFVGGMRGVTERNTMRYYLAIDAYLDSLSAPAGQQLENRLQAWFDATERYPHQLRELGREAYLRMKRQEVQRQAASPGSHP